jgi:hypothetical protein
MKGLLPRLPPFGFSAALALAASLAACGAAEFYVATNGNDAWSGLLPAPNTNGTDGPFATLEAAQNAIRSLKLASGLRVGGVRVNLRGGRYMRQSPFTLDGSSDSGTPTSPIVYQAYPGETPVIIGGINVTGFQAVTDQAILARLTPLAQTNVLVANLTAQAITNIIPLASHNKDTFWTWSGQNELFFQDQPMQLARWPNSNWLTIASSPSPGTNYFGYNGTNPSTWVWNTNIWVQGYWYNDQFDEFDNVSSIDTTNHIVYITSPASQYGYNANQRFYFLNVLEELDSPGEYYIDRVHGLLYFWPPSNTTNGYPFISTAISGLVSTWAVSNVAFSGITFEGAVGELIFIGIGQSNLITTCTLNGSSCVGVDIQSSPGSGVSYCSISNMGEIGVEIDYGGDRAALTLATNFATCNTIYNMSRLCWTWTPGVFVGVDVGTYVAHNLIYNGRHQAILVEGNNNVVEYNEIHNVCTETADAGAIYMSQDWTQRGNILRYNYLHDINMWGGITNPNGVTGIYLDEFFSGTTIYGNVFCAVDQGVLIGGGRDNTVQNNIFVGCTNHAFYVDQRGLISEAYSISDTNSFLWTELYAMPFQTPPWSIEYPALVSLPTNNPGAALGNVIQNNISYNNAMWFFSPDYAQTNIAFVNNFTNGDPLFVNYSQRQFGLATNSPVWALGFQPIPMNRSGPVPPAPAGLRVLGP